MKTRETARILVVDDDSENGKFLEEHLSGADCKTLWINDPRRALRTFRRGQYQVGIIDLKMPQMSGVELFKHLREKDPEIGLIIMTAYPSVDSALATLKTGAYDYLRKPFKIDDLKVIVHRILEEKGYFLEAEVVINQKIGRRIKEYRTGRRWTIAKLSAQTHLSKSLISQIENAKNSASLFSLAKIARRLNVRITELLQDI
jgi:DNA-binding NtrC family response regulator